MENNEYVAAIDLGTTKVVMAVGRKAEKNKIEIIALKEMVSNGVMKGDLRNIEQASQVLREVKASLEAELGIIVHEAYVGVSGQHILCNRTNGYVTVQNITDSGVTEVRDSDVERLIEDQRNASVPAGKTIISILPQSYTLDGEKDISEPVGMEGRKLEAQFNVITGEDSAIERIRRCFQRVGLKLSGIVLQPLASAEAVLSDDEKELGVAVIDIGGGTTDICIYYDKVIRHVAVIPIGGNVINKDIKAYGILERYVEKLKVSFGEAISERTPSDKYIKVPSVTVQAPKEIAMRTLAGIIEARMFDIIDLVNVEIERCGSKGKLGAGIVLTGGGANLKNLDVLFKMHTGLDIRVAQPLTHVTAESAELVASPKYSTLTGIILDAVRKGNYTEIEELVPAAEPESATATQQNNLADAAVGAGYASNQTADYNQHNSNNTEYRSINNDGDSYEQNHTSAYADDGEYLDEDQPEKEIKVRKRSFGEKIKGLISTMFSEEVDDDENNY